MDPFGPGFRLRDEKEKSSRYLRSTKALWNLNSVAGLKIADSLVLWPISSVTYSGCLAEGFLMRVDLGEQCFQVLAAELPLERASGGAVVILEAQQTIFDFSQGPEVIGCEHLALNNREVHLDLVEPAGVHRRMHRDDRGPTSLQAFDASLTAVRGAVVHDPEHPRGGSVGLLLHDLGDAGKIGSTGRQRARVIYPFEAPKPRSMTSRRISGTLQRDSGTSDSYGSWQAKALMATTRLGGKERWAPAARAFLQTS